MLRCASLFTESQVKVKLKPIFPHSGTGSYSFHDKDKDSLDSIKMNRDLPILIETNSGYE
jgi:hypothetical protein